MTFFCKDDQLGHRVIDVSSLALRHTLLPHSLGVRPQALKLRLITPEMKGTFFNPHVPLETIIQNIGMQLYPLNGSVSIGPFAYKAFIGETASLIYSPIFIHQYMAHDGILGKSLASIPKDFGEGLLSFGQQKDWQIKFVSTLCPHCGWDLLGERDSVALFCRNCISAWEASQIGLEELNFGIIPSKEDNVLYLPFWRMNVHIEGLKIRSYADLIKVANVPKVMKEEEEGSDLYFWSPAFKVLPELFLRLTQYPVTLPVSEAVESIKITIANLAIGKKMIFPKLNEINIHLNESLLVYLPFTSSGIDFIDPHTHLCIHKNYLKLGRNL
jgi:hypothetical protein